MHRRPCDRIARFSNARMRSATGGPSPTARKLNVQTSAGFAEMDMASIARRPQAPMIAEIAVLAGFTLSVGL